MLTVTVVTSPSAGSTPNEWSYNIFHVTVEHVASTLVHSTSGRSAPIMVGCNTPWGCTPDENPSTMTVISGVTVTYETFEVAVATSPP